MSIQYHKAAQAAAIAAPDADPRTRQNIIARIIEAGNTQSGSDFVEEVTLNLGVKVMSYNPGKPARMASPNNPGDPEEPEEIEIAVFNEAGEEMTSLLPDDVFRELERQAAEMMRGLER